MISHPSLFNLILYTEENLSLDYYEDMLKTTIARFPSNIIFIQHHPNSNESFCRTEEKPIKSSENSEMTCHQLIIRTAGNGISKVPFLILPSLVPDLPIYLIWGQDPTKPNDLFAHLYPYIDHLIFDSERAENLTSFAKAVIKKRKKWDCRIVDMNWARCSGWRIVLRQAYDTKEKIRDLNHSKKIVITYNQQSTNSFQHQEIQAIYLQSWLSTQLNWNFVKQGKEDGKFTFIYQAVDQEIHVGLEKAYIENFDPGAIVGFESETYDNKSTTLKRESDSPKQVYAQFCHEGSCELPFTIPLYTMSRGQTFIKYLLYSPIDAHYLNMMQKLSEQIK
ncbi:MAG: hypothetical protein Tsb0021_17100 [Chlamydiales bacterium]